MKPFAVTPAGIPNEGILFADLEKQDRSGHMGHALVQTKSGDVVAFYPNCSAQDPRWVGHSGFGWMEYKRSSDGGQTWSQPAIESHSKALFDRQIGRTLMCEKAVCCDSGKIVLFYLQCDMVTNGHIWEPYFEPQIAVSYDGCETFGPIRELFPLRGRVYDAVLHEGDIYVLFFANPELPGCAHTQEYDLQLYVSRDEGETFELLGKVPFTSMIHCYYGNLCFTPDGRLLVYTYDEKDEYNLKYIESADCGRTWGHPRRAYFDKKLRNPQMIFFRDRYFIHGRGGDPRENYGALMLYTSPDGVHWDEGQYLAMKKPGAGAGAYSNNLIVRTPDGRERLLIQSSQAYEANKTNVIAFWIDVE